MPKYSIAKSVVALLLCALMIVVPLAVQAATNPLVATINGTFTDVNGTGTFAGTFRITGFAVQNGQLVAVGLLSGTLTNALGQVLGTITNLATSIPVAASGSCQILTLTLGPLDLNLLGLMVHLNQVVLTITAQQGPGNLLGNLLCALAHLLDNNGPLSSIAALLNQILAAL